MGTEKGNLKPVLSSTGRKSEQNITYDIPDLFKLYCEVTETYESRHKSEMAEAERRVPGHKGASAEKERNNKKS